MVPRSRRPELKPLWREREPRHQPRQPGERRQDGTLCDNQHRMSPLTMAARAGWRWNESWTSSAGVKPRAADTLDRPRLDMPTRWSTPASWI